MNVPIETFCDTGIRMIAGRRANITNQVNYATRVVSSRTVVAAVITDVRAVRWLTGAAALKNVCR